MTPHARAQEGLRVRALLCGACALTSAGLPVFAQEGAAAIGIGQYGVSVKPLDRAAVGQTIASVEIEIAVSSGDPARDAAAVRVSRAATAGLVGSSYRPVLVDSRLERLVSDAAVRAAGYRVVVDGARGPLGILVSVDASTAAPEERAAEPRNDTDFSGLFTGEFGRPRFAFFYIDPDELEDLESNTTFAGANLGYLITDALSADVSVITIPTSDLSNRTPADVVLAREGTTTFGVHALYSPPMTDHVWLEAEAYRQTNDDYDMSALAYYGTLGYIRKSLPWSPSLSYRFASFSGDDPDTDTYQRFDPLMSTGLGNWLQGISFGKLYRNANLNTHRIQANVAPRAGMNLTFTSRLPRRPRGCHPGG